MFSNGWTGFHGKLETENTLYNNEAHCTTMYNVMTKRDTHTRIHTKMPICVNKINILHVKLL